MRLSEIILLVTLICAGCSVKPEPLNYGTDMCQTCKMTLIDSKFGGEVVTRKGKVYKFDDLNCMVNFLNSEFLNNAEIAHRLVIDYSRPGKLIDATQAFYLKSPEIRSPMAGSIAAFEFEADKDAYKKQWGAIYLTWGEVVAQFK
ncbi:MAG: hypothetical protein KatS3mg032_1937 [Cyclobacteriaceae bacterium]|nr:MAG: hypothetical protein KatS3mg032_1937 [Cyclobacteriaceae bacterium]